MILVCVGGLVSCKKNVENKRVDKLDFKGFSIAVPAGWNEVTDARYLKNLPAGTHTLMLVDAPSGFQPSIVIQDLSLQAAAFKFMQDATAETCRDAVQKPLLGATNTTAGPAKLAEIDGFKGCDIEMIDPSSPHAARQLSISNGKIAVSFVCNRDKQGAPEVDATCVRLASSITPTP
jgi:hypothetical protein